MPGVIQVHIGDQHADAVQDWLDGSVSDAWDEFRALLRAAENLMGSLQHQERGFATNYPQFATLRQEWFAIRRSKDRQGGIGQNTLKVTVAQMDDLFASWDNKTRNNDDADQRITRAKYATFDPAVWGREFDKKDHLYIVMDRDLTNEEANTWSGKHRVAVTGDEPEPEHNPRWVNYEADLVVPGHVQQKRRPVDDMVVATKADVRDPGLIVDVATGRPDTIVRVRVREIDGTVAAPNRIDEDPVKPVRQTR